MQKTDWREGYDAWASGSGGSALVRTVGTSRTETVNVGAVYPLALGACAVGAGVGLATDTRQQELFAGASRTVTEGACELIIGQWGVQCSTDAMCHKHEPSADNGIASNIITSAEATSLNRHVMSVNDTTGALPALPVTEITATCNRDYEPARRRQPRLIVLSVESVTDAGFLPRFTGHFRDRFRMYRYFVETLLIATTSKTTTSAPITVHIHIPPPIHP